MVSSLRDFLWSEGRHGGEGGWGRLQCIRVQTTEYYVQYWTDGNVYMNTRCFIGMLMGGGGFKNKVLRGIFGPTTEKVTGDWRKPYND